MDYKGLLEQVETIKHMPRPLQHDAKVKLWREVLQSVANGNWNGDIWAKIALTLDTAEPTNPRPLVGEQPSPIVPDLPA